jgi:hypothetical protein
MPIAFECPSCRKEIKVSSKNAGKRGKCPACGKPMTVPEKVGKVDEESDPADLARVEAEGAPEPEAATEKARTPSTPRAGKARSASRAPRVASRNQRLVTGIGLGVLGLVVITLIIANIVSSRREQEAIRVWTELRSRVAEARGAKTAGHDLASVGAAYESALKPLEGLLPRDEADVALLSAARTEAAQVKTCADLLAANDAAGFAAAIKGTTDADLLASIAGSLGKDTSPEVLSAGFAELARKERARALATLARAETVGEPALSAAAGAAAEATDEEVARAAAKVALSRGLPGPMAKVLDRFPQDEKLVSSVAEALKKQPGETAIPALRKLARNDRASISDAAVAALAALRPYEAAAEIALGLEASGELRRASLAAIRKMGDRAVPALSSAFKAGQASAAAGLAMIGSPKALGEIQGGLTSVDWKLRVDALDALTLDGRPPTAMLPAVESVVREAMDAVQTGTDPNTLEPLIGVARAFGARHAADDLDATLGFALAEKRRESIKIDALVEHERRSDLGSDSRFELDNDLGIDLLVYGVGPKTIKFAAPKGRRVGQTVPPGRYRIALAFARGAPGLLATAELTAGEASFISFRLEGRRGVDPGLSGQGSDRAKKEVARVFRVDELAEAARAAIARSAGESPFGSAGVQIEAEHYTITSDAGREKAAHVGELAEAAYAEYAKFIPPSQDRFVVRFFRKKEAFEAWRLKTSINAYVASRIVAEERLVPRTRAQAQRAKTAGVEYASIFEALGDLLETVAGLDRVSLDDLGPYEDALEKLEGALDPRTFERGVAEALRAIEVWTLGISEKNRGTLLGYHNRETRELCLYEGDGWETTLRHEAFHQFLCKRAPKAASWVHEGLATYFEASPQGGRNADRILELKHAIAQGDLRLDGLTFQSVAGKERLASLDYAVTWSFFYYLAEREPGVLGKVLARAKAGLATPAGVLEAFPDWRDSEAKWRDFVAGLVGA